MSRLRDNLTWTASQRGVIVGLSVVLLLIIAVLAWRHPQYIPNPPPERPAREARLADRIDPNTADVATLATLPGIGESRARAIVAHREAHVARGVVEPAYESVDDLLRVHGFGYAIVQQLREHLVFPPADEDPARTAATRPTR